MCVLDRFLTTFAVCKGRCSIFEWLWECWRGVRREGEGGRKEKRREEKTEKERGGG